jgi:hypothetical protein
MQKIYSEAGLRDEILRLEIKQAAERHLLKEHLLVVYKNVQPVNLVLRTLRKLMGSPELKGDLVSTSVGLATGYLSKLLIERGTRNPVKRVFGSVVMLGIVNLISRNPDAVKSLGKGFFNLFSTWTNPHVRHENV